MRPDTSAAAVFVEKLFASPPYLGETSTTDGAEKAGMMAALD
jgi:hypothetical protein